MPRKTEDSKQTQRVNNIGVHKQIGTFKVLAQKLLSKPIEILMANEFFSFQRISLYWFSNELPSLSNRSSSEGSRACEETAVSGVLGDVYIDLDVKTGCTRVEVSRTRDTFFRITFWNAFGSVAFTYHHSCNTARVRVWRCPIDEKKKKNIERNYDERIRVRRIAGATHTMFSCIFNAAVVRDSSRAPILIRSSVPRINVGGFFFMFTTAPSKLLVTLRVQKQSFVLKRLV